MKLLRSRSRWFVAGLVAVLAGCSGSIQDGELETNGDLSQELGGDGDSGGGCSGGDGDNPVCPPDIQIEAPTQVRYLDAAQADIVATYGSYDEHDVRVELVDAQGHASQLYRGSDWHFALSIDSTGLAPGAVYQLRVSVDYGEGVVSKEQRLTVLKPRLSSMQVIVNPTVRRLDLSVSDVSATAKQVTFYRNGQPIGVDTTSPYSWPLSASNSTGSAFAKVSYANGTTLQTGTISLCVGGCRE